MTRPAADGGRRREHQVVVLRGELDIATLAEAAARVEAAEAHEPAVLVIDLSELSFVDSSGVRLVLLADRRARDAGRRVAVRLGSGPALRVFHALGIAEKLDTDTDDGVGGGPGPVA
ncbi:STAS domain-containing protein [Pseudonocardia sp.]|uniref:STAS domain-containing protein n=1 Tax=Pseudonocardia sp. TaxID=60912 RepID=UPI002608A2EA|nr:STAS domain-containing protein [Pseudonocardia sp.]